MRGGITQGVTDSGLELVDQTSLEGRKLVEAPTVEGLLGQLLVELRAVRVGLELALQTDLIEASRQD